ncbi:MAG: hypothetical protein CMR00_02560 [[Chlorobium] sp. 445]|nr:MAG: hypothetical protein CMR00_02560 [[Chlorobium] sp. 445]
MLGAHLIIRALAESDTCFNAQHVATFAFLLILFALHIFKAKSGWSEKCCCHTFYQQNNK